MRGLVPAALVSTIVFVGLLLLLFSLEQAFDNPLDTRNLLGVGFTAISAVVAAATGAWQAGRRGRRGAARFVAAAAPPCVLSVVLALIGGAGTAINVAAAIAGVLGALAGAYLFHSVRA